MNEAISPGLHLSGTDELSLGVAALAAIPRGESNSERTVALLHCRAWRRRTGPVNRVARLDVATERRVVLMTSPQRLSVDGRSGGVDCCYC